jgi:hypothetical protein
MGSWDQNILSRFGGAKTAITEAKAAVAVAREAMQEAEDSLEDALDRLAQAAAEMPSELTGVRAKEPCTPCARAAAEEAARMR